MNDLIQAAADYIKNFDWSSPQAFGAAAIIAAIMFQRWMIMAVVLIIMVIGANIEQFIVINYEFNNYTVTSPFLVYAIGSVIVFFLTFLSLFNR